MSEYNPFLRAKLQNERATRTLFASVAILVFLGASVGVTVAVYGMQWPSLPLDDMGATIRMQTPMPAYWYSQIVLAGPIQFSGAPGNESHRVERTCIDTLLPPVDVSFTGPDLVAHFAWMNLSDASWHRAQRSNGSLAWGEVDQRESGTVTAPDLYTRVTFTSNTSLLRVQRSVTFTTFLLNASATGLRSGHSGVPWSMHPFTFYVTWNTSQCAVPSWPRTNPPRIYLLPNWKVALPALLVLVLFAFAIILLSVWWFGRWMNKPDIRAGMRILNGAGHRVGPSLMVSPPPNISV